MNNKIALSLLIAVAVMAGISTYFFFPKSTTKIQVFSESDARAIAEKSCVKGGEALSAGTYNENSKTWWFDANLNATKPGCNPACVVFEETKTTEINWRCTGAVPPKETPVVTTKGTVCIAEQRKAEVCAQIYQPVCATVQIQCIKAPCDPIKQTFENVCTACQNSLVASYTQGECKNK